MDRQDILTRHDELRDLRALEEGAWRDIATLIQPDQGMSPWDKGNARFSEVYDATALYALDNFTGGIFGQLTNPTNRWIEIATDDAGLNAWQPVKSWSYQVTSQILASLGPAVSGFYEECGQWFNDVGSWGNGVMYQEEDVGQDAFADRAIPLGQSYWDTDSRGRITVFHREFRLRGRQLPKDWRAGLSRVDDASEYAIVHAVFENPDYVPGRAGRTEKPWLSVYVSTDLRELDVRASYYEMPYHVIRWTKRAASAYGTGPGHRARADVSMLNEMERTHITAAQFAADPMMLVDNDSVLSVADIQPGNLLYGTVSDQGRPMAMPYNRGQNLQLSMQQSEQRRNAIRDAFYFGLMQLLQRPQMTATEFLGFQEEKLRLMGPNLVHIQTGGLSPMIARRYNLLQRAGKLPPPPPELANKRLQVVYQSPLALAQRAATARATINFTNVALQWAQANPDILDNVDFDAALGVVHDGMGPPPSILRDPRDVAQRRQAKQGQQQLGAALEQGGQAADIAATVAHAQQANTLATDRSAA